MISLLSSALIAGMCEEDSLEGADTECNVSAYRVCNVSAYRVCDVSAYRVCDDICV